MPTILVANKLKKRKKFINSKNYRKKIIKTTEWKKKAIKKKESGKKEIWNKVNKWRNIFRQPEMVSSFLPFTFTLSQQKTCSGSPRWSPPSTNCSWPSPSLTSSMSPQTLSTIPLLRCLYFTNILDCSIVKVPLLHKHCRLFHC